MRICFFGTPQPALPALHQLAAATDVEIVRVVSNPDRPRGRGHQLQPTPVKAAAQDLGLEVWQPERPKEIGDELAALQVDACAIVAYGAILPQPVLDAGGRGFVNLHFSLLPAWRGAAPVPHAILAGDTEAGVSCFLLEEGMDTGPILTEARTRIGPDETSGDLTGRLAELGAPALLEALRGLVDGTITPRPQPQEGVTYAPKIGVDDARLDWTRPAVELDRAVRAFNPVPGAHTTFEGQRLKVHRARPVAGSGAPGSVLRVDADGPRGGPVVATGRGALRLDEVQPAGKGRMPGSDFANGYRPVGATLGDGGDAS